MNDFPQQMRAAGDVLDEATARRRLTGELFDNRWSGADLRSYASAWESEDRAQVDEMENHLRGLYYSWCGDMPHHPFAKGLIDLGWRKA